MMMQLENAYGANLAKAEGAFAEMAEKGDNKNVVKLLDDAGKMLDMDVVIKSLKARYGKELDGREMQEIKQAFGSEEAVSFVTAMWDAAKGVMAQQKELKVSGAGGLADARNMASVMDKDNIDATMKLAEQAVDLAKQQAAETKRENITEYYAANKRPLFQLQNASPRLMKLSVALVRLWKLQNSILLLMVMLWRVQYLCCLVWQD